MQISTRSRNLPGRLYAIEVLILALVNAVFGAIIFPIFKEIRVHHAVYTAHHILIGTLLSWVVAGIYIHLNSKLPDANSKFRAAMQGVGCLIMLYILVTVVPFIFLALLALRWYIHPTG